MFSSFSNIVLDKRIDTNSVSSLFYIANNNYSNIPIGFAVAYAYNSVSAYYLILLSVDLKFVNMIIKIFIFSRNFKSLFEYKN